MKYAFVVIIFGVIVCGYVTSDLVPSGGCRGFGIFISIVIFVLGVLMIVGEYEREKKEQYAQEENYEREKQERRRQEREKAKEIEKNQKERIERELEEKKDSDKLFMSWEPIPWRDKTKSICKISAELWGKYNLIEDQWNSKPMRLNFSYEEKMYSFEIDFDTCMALKDMLIDDVLPGTTGKIEEMIVKIFYYDNDWYFTHEDISFEDAGILIKATRKRDQEKLAREIERARNLLDGQKTELHRQVIPDKVMSFVWNRDGGCCVKCGRQEKLEFDHIIPVSKGGSNTARNLQLLCEECNRIKRDKI